jgi:hypothetical protein
MFSTNKTNIHIQFAKVELFRQLDKLQKQYNLTNGELLSVLENTFSVLSNKDEK